MTEPPRLGYAESVAALTERGRFGISLGLARAERLMAELGRPDRGLRGALVGGTNGKGSVIAMTQSVLSTAGYRVGTMPKPHLVTYRERIAVDGAPISKGDFARAVSTVLPAIDRIAADVGPPTEFEALTAAAITELGRRAVDLAIVEVGMGGRLDATNVLDLGVAAITNVQLDHQAHLGSTLTAIGGEKAAIIKAGNLAVTGAGGRGLRPILDRCNALGVPLRRAGRRREYSAELADTDWGGITVHAATPHGRLPGLHVALLGAHQADNAAVALAVIDAVVEQHQIQVSEADVRAGLSATTWPGRLELLDGSALGLRRVLLDGAHNPAGARALARALADLGLRRPTIIFGAMRTKDARGVLLALAPLQPRFVFTRAADAGARPPEELAAEWSRLGGEGARVAPTTREALATGADADPLVVAGSLYLVGEVRGMIVPVEDAA